MFSRVLKRAAPVWRRAENSLMSETAAQESRNVVGSGSPESDLSSEALKKIVANALAGIGPGARVLAIVPDKTRDDNTDVLFSLAAGYLKNKGVETCDALIAQGTHVPMTADEKRGKLGIGE